MDGGRRAALMGLGAAALAVGACGFEPLYADRSGGAFAGLAPIQVALIPDREGQILRNALIDRFGQAGGRARYELAAELSITRASLGIQRDETATRGQVTVQVGYTLRRIDGAVPVDQGIVRLITSFNLVDNEFASETGSEAAIAQSLEQAADEIRNRVALALRTEQG